MKQCYHRKNPLAKYLCYIGIFVIGIFILHYLSLAWPVAGTLIIAKNPKTQQSVIIQLPIVSSLYFNLKIIPTEKNFSFDDFSLVFENIQSKKRTIVHVVDYDRTNSFLHFGGKHDRIISSSPKIGPFLYLPPGKYKVTFINKSSIPSSDLIELSVQYFSTMRVLGKTPFLIESENKK